MVCTVDVHYMASLDQNKEPNNKELTPKQQIDLKNNRLVKKLLWMVLGSLLFAFALVPLYDVLCTLTGLNGKTSNTAAVLSKAKVDNTRWVNVQFITSVMPGLGWNFYPKQSVVRVHPGQIETVIFVAKNTTNEEVVGRAATLHERENECARDGCLCNK